MDSQVQSGRYETTGEVIRAALALLEEREAQAKAIVAALIEGEQSGDPIPFDRDAFKARKRAEYQNK